jgi:hypothetical protein
MLVALTVGGSGPGRDGDGVMGRGRQSDYDSWKTSIEAILNDGYHVKQRALPCDITKRYITREYSGPFH